MAEVAALKRKLATYLPAAELDKVEAAYRYSEAAHAGQRRDSGAPFVSHPATVADILADWRLDSQTVIAALLHDVVEDTPRTLAEVEGAFGGDVARMVDGVSKMERLESRSVEERQAENFRKMLLAVARDFRVIFIKLADRLHNMRTLAAVAAPRRRRVAAETLDIYAPIAERFGLAAVRDEMQNLAFRHLHPRRWQTLVKALKNSAAGSRRAVARAQATIEKGLAESSVAVRVSSRKKNLYSIYRKMEQNRLSFAEVEDIVGFRIIAPDRLGCYLALGAVHQLFRPVPQKFKDYIAIPKSNGYQSLHTTVVGEAGIKIELQIRTPAMHDAAENGVAAHWLYKQGGADASQVQQQANLRLQSLIKLHAENTGAREFLEHVKIDLFPDEIYALTPKGKIVTMPRGATALDFAYAIHTDLGDRASAAKINGQHMPIAAKLETGDMVEVIASDSAAPMPHWLGYVITAKARSHIRHILRTTQGQESAALGRKLLLRALAKKDATTDDIADEEWRAFLASQNLASREELFRRIGLGTVIAEIAARALIKRAARTRKNARRVNGELGPMTIAGAGNTAIRLSQCCRPIPPEPIIAVLQKDKGLIVHSHLCPAALKMNKKSEKWIDVAWDETARARLFHSAISVECENRRGIAGMMTQIISGESVNIVSFNFAGGQLENEYVAMEFVVDIRDEPHLSSLLDALRNCPQVARAERIMRES